MPLPLKVLISGGGITGPTLAHCLTGLGHSCTIVERFPHLRTHGQQIDLRGHVMTAIKRMGLKDEIMKHNIVEKGLKIVNAQGQEQVFIGRHEEDDGMVKTFTSEIEIMRANLNTVLYDATKAQTKYQFGRMVEDYEVEEDGVKVKFSDKVEEKFDLLVAADGHYSRIRKMMLQKDQGIKDDSVKVGVFIAYFKVPRRPEDEGVATLCNLPGRRAIITRWQTKDMGQGVFFTRADPDIIRASLGKDVDAQKEAFGRVFAGGGWQCDRLTEAMRQADDFYAEEVTQRKSNRWHSGGRVLLLGDAAFAPGAITGLGTSLAMLAPYVLAGELAKHGSDNIAAGLEAFHKTFSPYVKQSQTLPPGVGGPLFPQSQFGVRMLHWIIKTIVWLGLPEKMAWLDSGSKWELPKYKELEDTK